MTIETIDLIQYKSGDDRSDCSDSRLMGSENCNCTSTLACVEEAEKVEDKVDVECAAEEFAGD